MDTALSPALLSCSLFPSLLIGAAASDVGSMKIPNLLCGLMALLFIPVALLSGMPLADLGLHLAVGVAALLVGMVLFAFGGFGGGDAKLIAAAAVWLGPDAVLPFIAYTALAGGGLTLIVLALRAYAKPFFAAPPRWLDNLMAPNGSVPYGVAIAIGGITAFPVSQLARLTGFNF